MGGKRPEQIHKDKLSTDYKSRTDDPRIHEQDKQHLKESRGKLAQKNEKLPRPDNDATGEA